MYIYREREVLSRARAHTHTHTHTQALWDASSADEAVTNLEALTVAHLDTWLQQEREMPERDRDRGGGGEGDSRDGGGDDEREGSSYVREGASPPRYVEGAGEGGRGPENAFYVDILYRDPLCSTDLFKNVSSLYHTIYVKMCPDYI